MDLFAVSAGKWSLSNVRFRIPERRGMSIGSNVGAGGVKFAFVPQSCMKRQLCGWSTRHKYERNLVTRMNQICGIGLCGGAPME
jgi:hypothetical protein